MPQESSSVQSTNQPGPIFGFLYYLFFFFGSISIAIGLAIMAMLSYTAISGHGFGGDSWGRGYAAAADFVIGYFGIASMIASFVFYYLSSYFKTTKHQSKIILFSFIGMFIAIFLIPYLLDKISNNDTKPKQAILTLRCTRTPPALPSALSQLPASSASFSASVQAGPVSFIR